MPHYVILFNWTDQGIKNIRESPKRVVAAREAVEKAGGKWLGFYNTIGQYDGVAIIEALNDEGAMSFLLAIGSLGNVRTTTLKAFTEAEVAKIIEQLP
jgi:uncharacterized protein with GYD domain